MSERRQYFTNILQLNLAVLLISTSGVLGRYIVLHPVVTIFYRCLLAVLVFYLYCRWKKIDLKIENKRDLLKMVLGGVLMGGHWITYFFSLQYSSVAIALLSLFTYPVITAFLEPILFKTRFNKIHIALGLLVLAGIYFLSPEFDLENDYFIAIIFGIASAIFYAFRNLLMKREVERYNGSALMFYQILVISILLVPAVIFSDFEMVLTQWKPLLMLAVITTCIGHTLFLKSFKNFTITAASIMSSIQPVYGIILGMIFLNEVPSLKTVIGGTLIISAVVIESLISMRKNPEAENS
ncbi:DMT family transporter [Christiangramia echinicola]|uniref:Permease of the drug/metabolite transporter (DMT) superfamily n=1 Tax=Christiangramia echinicola TaxID=279359 RepID=A0A1H1QHC2_9FLAO|nr:DMT family transporter [Christiangramia echinicola]SDS22850.1 Permease of the drug/metabolite transporter (DMT) superfamily [Christiangramia echinicola]